MLLRKWVQNALMHFFLAFQQPYHRKTSMENVTAKYLVSKKQNLGNVWNMNKDKKSIENPSLSYHTFTPTDNCDLNLKVGHSRGQEASGSPTAPNTARRISC